MAAKKKPTKKKSGGSKPKNPKLYASVKQKQNVNLKYILQRMQMLG